mgnify:CR=1 FL=1
MPRFTSKEESYHGKGVSRQASPSLATRLRICPEARHSGTATVAVRSAPGEAGQQIQNSAAVADVYGGAGNLRRFYKICRKRNGFRFCISEVENSGSQCLILNRSRRALDLCEAVLSDTPKCCAIRGEVTCGV